ncbi:hypothetical protein KP509_03G096100 [Ceratopteris richardii]|uniref:Uncharacterized protein n=1 Tax=Ceratopteris richardii TaxID=49495 RepID=A0A8T2V5X6_CERRI|nr:hypothetical protein KP509_03G096100 [Ceratopteris richardii]
MIPCQSFGTLTILNVMVPSDVGFDLSNAWCPSWLMLYVDQTINNVDQLVLRQRVVYKGIQFSMISMIQCEILLYENIHSDICCKEFHTKLRSCHIF